ncbi:MAG TPA: methyltransferase domain-containing protein [Dehalococcoidia bacterium]
MDRARHWNQRYSQAPGEEREPASLLVENLVLLPLGGKALDLAMGTGRNAVYLATLGFHVTGIDISPVAVQMARSRAHWAGVKIEGIVANLERYRIPENTYDLIINFYYLQRSLAPQILRALRPGGVLCFETFTQEQRRYGRPHTISYLLEPGELAEMFPGLETLHYFEGVVEEGPRKKAIASLIARKPPG